MSRLGRAFGVLMGRDARRATSHDAARTTPANRRHWRDADNLAPVSSLTPGVRSEVRKRARLEVTNGCYARGVVRTLVNDTVGKGPRLQLLTDDDKLNAAVEGLWREWAAAADWPLTCRVLAGVRYVAGECFAVYHDSRRLDRLGLPVTLDLKLIEPDQVADPFASYLFRASGDDGVECDDRGEVVAYKVLKAHPGDLRTAYGYEADRVSADDILHWFVPERPGQLRGVTPLEPALPIFAQLRRYTSATLTAAEVAAMMAGVIETDLPPPGADDGGNGTGMQARAFDTLEMVEGMLISLPQNWKATPFKADQPTTGYGAFVAAKLEEIGRAINMPYGKVAGNHSAYNYSSGRLDDAPYWSDRDIERQALEAKVYNPFFYRWCDFARFALPALAAYQGRWWQLAHAWQYDARPTSDPVKDANGDEINLTNGSDTLTDIAAREGTTVEALVAKRKKEKELFEAAGLTPPPWLVAGSPAPVRTQDGPPAQATPRGAALAA